MAKVYSPPVEFVTPELTDFLSSAKDTTTGYENYKKACDNYLDQVIDWIKSESTCPDAGKLISWVVGDGTAMYLIYNYRTLIHFTAGDNYSLDQAHERGIRKADMVQKVKASEALRPMPTFSQGYQSKYF